MADSVEKYAEGSVQTGSCGPGAQKAAIHGAGELSSRSAGVCSTQGEWKMSGRKVVAILAYLWVVVMGAAVIIREMVHYGVLFPDLVGCAILVTYAVLCFGGLYWLAT
jgi:hypothetical protein